MSEVPVDVEALITRIRRERFTLEVQSPHNAEHERGYRVGWNHAMGHVERLLRAIADDVIP